MKWCVLSLGITMATHRSCTANFTNMQLSTVHSTGLSAELNAKARRNHYLIVWGRRLADCSHGQCKLKLSQQLIYSNSLFFIQHFHVIWIVPMLNVVVLVWIGVFMQTSEIRRMADGVNQLKKTPNNCCECKIINSKRRSLAFGR